MVNKGSLESITNLALFRKHHCLFFHICPLVHFCPAIWPHTGLPLQTPSPLPSLFPSPLQSGSVSHSTAGLAQLISLSTLQFLSIISITYLLYQRHFSKCKPDQVVLLNTCTTLLLLLTVLKINSKPLPVALKTQQTSPTSCTQPLHQSPHSPTPGSQSSGALPFLFLDPAKLISAMCSLPLLFHLRGQLGHWSVAWQALLSFISQHQCPLISEDSLTTQPISASFTPIHPLYHPLSFHFNTYNYLKLSCFALLVHYYENISPMRAGSCLSHALL